MSSSFLTEAEMVEVISRIAATLPKELRERMNFGNGEVQVLQVMGADIRRNDAILYSCGMVYGVEFKRGILTAQHLYESIIERRYSIILRARYAGALAGIVFVAEGIADDIRCDSPIIKTLSELSGCGITTRKIDEFARGLISLSLREIVANPASFSVHTLSQYLAQISALTSSSDGYPEWFSDDWARSFHDKYYRLMATKSCVRNKGV